MAITWEWIRNLNLRNKLALIYTVAFNLILGVTLFFIYSISEQNRSDVFFRRLSDRALSTFKISVQVEQIDNTLLRIFDQNTINRLSDEKVMIFDSSGNLFYSSIDDTRIDEAASMLKELHGDADRLEVTEAKYQIVGTRLLDKGRTFYGFAKAYDKYGRSKIRFLAFLLVGTFITVAIIISLLSFYLSTIITKPISQLTHQVEKLSPDDLLDRVHFRFPNDEVGFLAHKFNELLDKIGNALKFQKHYIHHLSHELKTPLAIMMANAERTLAEKDNDKLKKSMEFQKNAIMELSHIINAMLDIAKTENKLAVPDVSLIRIDELLFECMDEIIFLNDDLRFDFVIDTDLDEHMLTIAGNSRMVKLAIINLVKNAVNFSREEMPAVEISALGNDVQIKISNDGETIDEEDQAKLFKHLFRGKNSKSVNGFGLGLVLAHRVILLHKGDLTYSIDARGRNCFTLKLPVAAGN